MVTSLLCFAIGGKAERERGRKQKAVFRFFRGWVGLGWVESRLEMLICKMPAFLGPEERPMDPSKN